MQGGLGVETRSLVLGVKYSYRVRGLGLALVLCLVSGCCLFSLIWKLSGALVTEINFLLRFGALYRSLVTASMLFARIWVTISNFALLMQRLYTHFGNVKQSCVPGHYLDKRFGHVHCLNLPITLLQHIFLAR